MGLVSLYKAIKEMRRMKIEADGMLEKSIEDCPEVADEYEKWRKTYRLNTTAFCAHVARQFCKLEGEEFDREKKKKAYLGSASACMSDDLTDKSLGVDSKEVYFLDERYHLDEKLEGELGLFYALHSALERSLPSDFQSRFRGLIGRYNEAQERGKELNGSAGKEEVIEIKNGTGGYPFLLLHRITFPDREDLTEDFAPDYSPRESITPMTKDHAIFNFGAMASRFDDLSDSERDKSEGRISLTTEGLVNWKTIGQDRQYVREGFLRFYPEERVESVMSIYSSCTIPILDGILSLVRKIKN